MVRGIGTGLSIACGDENARSIIIIQLKDFGVLLNNYYSYFVYGLCCAAWFKEL